MKNIEIFNNYNVEYNILTVVTDELAAAAEDVYNFFKENNFRYLACIDLYLPNSKVILQPTCHSELFIYAEDYNKILPVLKEVTDNSELVLSKNAFDWK